MDRRTGVKVYTVAVIAAVTIGLSFLFVKVSLSYASPLQALFFRFLIAFLGSLVLIMTGITKLNLRGKKLLPVLAPALLYSAGFFGFQFFGMLYASSVEAGIIMAAQPAITMVVAELTIKEKPTKIQRFCVLVAILAAAFISVYGSGGVESVDPRGVILITLSAVSMAANVVFIRWIREDYTPAEVSFLSCAVGFLIYTAVILVWGITSGNLGETFALVKQPGFMGAMLYLGIGCTTLTTLMNSYIMRHLEAVKASVTSCIGTVVTLVAGVLILKESLGILQVLCAVLILLAVVGTNYFGKKN